MVIRGILGTKRCDDVGWGQVLDHNPTRPGGRQLRDQDPPDAAWLGLSSLAGATPSPDNRN